MVLINQAWLIATGSGDTTQRLLLEGVEQSSAGRVRRHETEQRGLIDQHCNIADRSRAIGDRSREID